MNRSNNQKRATTTKGRAVNSSAERKRFGRKPWQGVPNACRKAGVPKYEQY